MFTAVVCSSRCVLWEVIFNVKSLKEQKCLLDRLQIVYYLSKLIILMTKTTI